MTDKSILEILESTGVYTTQLERNLKDIDEAFVIDYLRTDNRYADNNLHTQVIQVQIQYFTKQGKNTDKFTKFLAQKFNAEKISPSYVDEENYYISTYQFNTPLTFVNEYE